MRLHVTLLLCCCIALAIAKDDKKSTFPPRMVEMPPPEKAYYVKDKVGGQVELPCRAEAEPSPDSYRWTKDGEPLAITGTDIRKLPGVGTLIIEEPTDAHEGIYQCFATNQYGTAVSIRSHLKKAFMEPFDTGEVKERSVDIGEKLTLFCNPPKSYPTGRVYWGGGGPTPVNTSARVAVDYEGNLRFANIIQSDDLGGEQYICIAENRVLRSLVQGDDQKILPRPVAGTLPYRAPLPMWISETPTVALKGSTKRMKCIFAGYPTPKVQWTRKDSKLPAKVKTGAHGLELVIPGVESTDAGTYVCSASGMEDTNLVSREIQLTVESMPFWLKEPSNLQAAEEEDAEIACEVAGNPNPTVEWSYNGKPISELPPDSRRTLVGNTIKFTNLTKVDSAVLQCNASNKHGYIFANAYLNVKAEPPSFLQAPKPVVKVAEGMDVDLTCRVFGAPTPVITWKKEGEDIDPNDRRYELKESGDLHIKNVVHADEGRYECQAVNKFGQNSATGRLLVRDATRITLAPEDQTVNATDNVEFFCEAVTDENEESHLTVEWRRNGEEIDYTNEKRIQKNMETNTLTIVQATVADSGEYTCVASNRLDEDTVTVQLNVRDKPDPPFNVRLISCGSVTAELSWEPGNENNLEIIEYMVYYNTSFDPPNTFHLAKNVTRNTHTTKISVSPWTNYTFHLRARNELGVSERSAHTPAACSTIADIPYRNPRKVCTESRDSHQLVIVWEPMDRIDHNGPNFHYEVSYQRMDIPNSRREVEKIVDWQQSEFVVYNVETFKEYEISVLAGNEKGMARNRQIKIGYSGEGKPLDAPGNVRIDEDTLNATSVEFLWDPVPDDPARIQGLFTGYEVHFWRAEEPEDIRIHKVSVAPGEFCRSRGHGGRGDNARRRRAADDEPVRAHVNDLWPYSQVSAGVLVTNSKNSGSLSAPPIEFSTPEGVPDIVSMFEVRERGSHHFGVAWAPPLLPNGVLIGYTIGHQERGSVNLETDTILDPLRRSAKIKNLNDNTDYSLYIWAMTSEGKGVEMYIEDRTLVAAAPDIPGFSDIIPGDDSINVTWVPSEGETKNPGSEFYVEYRKAGEDGPWDRTDPDGDENWANITGLDTGSTYEIRIVAINGRGEETKSPIKKVRVGPQEGPTLDIGVDITTPNDSAPIWAPAEGYREQNIATAGWFVGMMCAIIFLLLVLIIVCLIKRNRGGKYPVHEREKLRGPDADKDDEGGFGEYNKTPPMKPKSKVPYMELKSDEPDYKKSAGSLESETKPLDSDSMDSMEEYDETDPSKFNEDGSFIGQYGGKKTKEEKEPDATSPSALSTFV